MNLMPERRECLPAPDQGQLGTAQPGARPSVKPREPLSRCPFRPAHMKKLRRLANAELDLEAYLCKRRCRSARMELAH
jgi:hypothetical protein